MLQRLFACFVFAAAMVATSSTANAKKAPIPCTGDRFVAVAAPEFNKLVAKQGLHLAYRFSGCSGSEFVVYDGKSRYKALPAAMVAEVQQKEAVSEPSVFVSLFTAPGQFFVEWLYLIVIGFIAIAVMVSNRNKGEAGSDEARTGRVTSA